LYLKGIKRKDVDFILDCLKWNKWQYSLKPPEECWNQQDNIDKMNEIINKLKEAKKHGIKNN